MKRRFVPKRTASRIPGNLFPFAEVRVISRICGQWIFRRFLVIDHNYPNAFYEVQGSQ
jgi:hypothetical protein